PGAHVDRGRLALPEHEDDVTRDVTAAGAAPEPAASGTAPAPASGTLERRAHRAHRVLFVGRERLARHALLERRTDLRLRDARRQLNRAAIGSGHRVSGRLR